MAAWDNLFGATASAAGALVGLIFVGISLNYAKILQSKHLPNRAQEALLLLAINLVLATLLLVPQPSDAIGYEVLGIGILAWLLITRLHVDIYRLIDPTFRNRATAYAALGQFAVLPVPIAGIMIHRQGQAGLYFLVPSILLSYVVAILNAWILTIEISR
jgi:hypothetical protein